MKREVAVDPVVVLESEQLAVEPGGSVAVTVRVKNVGERVERYRLEVLGPAVGWSQIVPGGELRVFVDDETQATVLFTPPKGPDVPSGTLPFGIKATSLVDHETSAVAEGDIEVAETAELAASIRPVASKGRWRGRHQLEIANWGNADVRLHLSVSDPDEQLGFLLRPEILDVPVGKTANAHLGVRARHPFLRGTRIRLPFKVTTRAAASAPTEIGASPETAVDIVSFGKAVARHAHSDAPARRPPPHAPDPRYPTVDGAFEQKPILSRGSVAAGMLAVAGLIALAAWAYRGEGSPFAPTVPPPAPTDFTSEAVAADAVLLSWRGPRNVDAYELQVLDPEGRVLDTEDVESSKTAHEVTELEPGREHCFGLVAIRGEARSPEAASTCTTTPAAGELVPPSGVTVAATGVGKALVSWTDTNDGTATYVLLKDGAEVASVVPPARAAPVDVGAGENCFEVVARAEDGRQSAPIPACATFSEEQSPASGGVGGGGVIGDGGGGGSPPPGAARQVDEETGIVTGERGWIAVVSRFFESDPTVNPQQQAIARRAELTTDEQPFFVLSTEEFPHLSPSPFAWYVYTKFPDQQAAQDFCDRRDAEQAATAPSAPATPGPEATGVPEPPPTQRTRSCRAVEVGPPPEG